MNEKGEAETAKEPKKTNGKSVDIWSIEQSCWARKVGKQQILKPISTIWERKSCSSACRGRVGQWMGFYGLTWPSCCCVPPHWRCSCLPISLCSLHVSKPPPPSWPDILTLMLNGGSERERRTNRQMFGLCVQVYLPQTVDRQQDNDNKKQGYDQCRRQHVRSLMKGGLWIGHVNTFNSLISLTFTRIWWHLVVVVVVLGGWGGWGKTHHFLHYEASASSFVSQRERK